MTRTNFRWVIIALVFFITTINYVDRSAIGYAMEKMSILFHFTPNDEGLIFGAFGIGYLITTFLGGIAVDRYGPRLILTIATLLWSVAIGLTGLATGFLIAYLARSLLGFAEGPNFPALTRAVGDWLPSHERARSLSYALVAVPIALAIGAPIVTQLIIHFSWRGMFFILFAVSLIWVPLWWFLFRNFPEESTAVNQAELDYIRETKNSPKSLDTHQHLLQRRNIPGLWRYLFTNPTLLVNNWAFFVFGYFLFFFMAWLPTYLADQYHLNLKQIGLFSILPWALAAILLWLAGYLSDNILRKTNKLRWARSHLIWVSQLIAALSIVPIILTHNIHVAIIFISLAVGFSMSANSAYYATNVDIAKERAGSALGVMDTAFAIAGFLAPVITGWIVTTTGSFKSAFILMGALALSSVVLVLIWHRPDSAVKLAEKTL